MKPDRQIMTRLRHFDLALPGFIFKASCGRDRISSMWQKCLAGAFFERMKGALSLLIGNRSGRAHRFAVAIRNLNSRTDRLPVLVLDFERQETNAGVGNCGGGWPLIQFDTINVETARKWFCGLNRKSETNRFGRGWSCKQKPGRLP